MEAIMTSTMSHCWVRTLCTWVCKKCAKYHHIFAHLNAYPRNFMCVYNNGIIVDVIIASQRRSNVLHFTQHIPILRVFWTAKTPHFRYDLRTWEDQCLQTMYKQIGTIFWNSFVIDDNVELFWVTFDPSVATLSINTLWLSYSTNSPYTHAHGVSGTIINRLPWILRWKLNTIP